MAHKTKTVRIKSFRWDKRWITPTCPQGIREVEGIQLCPEIRMDTPSSLIINQPKNITDAEYITLVMRHPFTYCHSFEARSKFGWTLPSLVETIKEYFRYRLTQKREDILHQTHIDIKMSDLFYLLKLEIEFGPPVRVKCIIERE
jgi:hypothetical protein